MSTNGCLNSEHSHLPDDDGSGPFCWPRIHLHGPVSGPVCGAPTPKDRKRHLTAWRSGVTCSDCLATLR